MKNKTDMLDKALRKNRFKEFQELMPEADVTYEGNFPLYYAVEYGYVEIFHMLIKDQRVRRREIPAEVFKYACTSNKIEVVKTLLQQKTLKKFQNSIDIKDSLIEITEFYKEQLEYKNQEYWATEEEIKTREEIINILLSHKRGKEALNYIKKELADLYKVLMPFIVKDKVSSF